MAIPKLHSGSYFPDRLLTRRERPERALTSVVATCYVLGVSKRRIERLVESLRATILLNSQGSVMAAELDQAVEKRFALARSTPCGDAAPARFPPQAAVFLAAFLAGEVVADAVVLAGATLARHGRETEGFVAVSPEVSVKAPT